MRKFAAFDIDGTLFRGGLYREVFYELHKLGSLPSALDQEVTQRYRDWRHRTHGTAFEEFEKVMCAGVDIHLPHLRIADYDAAVKNVLDKNTDNVYVYTRTLLAQLQSEGYVTIAVSGSQEELVKPFAQRYGFDAWVGQKWERGEEYFTGNATKTHTGKDEIIRQLMAAHNLTLDGSYGVGDSNGDSGMLAMVENPIAFNPTYELMEKAIEHGWKIVIERKNISYELTQGASHGPYILEKANQQ